MSWQCLAYFCHDGVTQSGVISPKNEIDQPLALEHMHRGWMNVRPPIVSVEIIRHLEFGGVQWQGGCAGGEPLPLVLTAKVRTYHCRIALRRQVPYHRFPPEVADGINSYSAM